MAGKTPTCHPDRKHKARGLCNACYQKSRYDPAKNAEECKRWRESNRDRVREGWRNWYRKNNERERQNLRDRYKKNADKMRTMERARYLRNRDVVAEKSKWKHLRRKYGLSEAQFQSMLDQQGGVCAICKELPATHIDHDHATGKVRAVLCHYCNVSLGLMRENTRILLDAAAYLDLHEALPFSLDQINPRPKRILAT